LGDVTDLGCLGKMLLTSNFYKVLEALEVHLDR
jgi:hypothetical protein